VVVSHDRYFLERVCDTIWALLGDGSLVLLPGGVDDYLSRRRAYTRVQRPAPVDRPATPRPPDLAGPAQRSTAEHRAARKELARIDRQFGRVNEQISAIQEQMAAHATDVAKLTALDSELTDLTSDRDRLEQAWLEAVERAEP
jgi:ATP-binding cassette subfamily F protein uup